MARSLRLCYLWLAVSFSASRSGAAAASPSHDSAPGASTPQHVRLTFSANASRLSVGWGSTESPAGASLVAWGPARVPAAALPFRRAGVGRTYASDLCANTSRAVHVAELDAAAGGAPVFYAVSSDGGATFSAVFEVRAPGSSYPQVVALWGDMAIEGFNAPVTAAAQLARDAEAGAHHHAVHIGDAAYNMNDGCSAVGDRFLAAAEPYASRAPLVYGNGNHESGPLYQYSEFVNRLGAPQEALARASGSNSSRWLAWTVGRARFFSVDADAWAYPAVYGLAQPQWEWLNASLAAVDRAATPWLVLFTHRALYCTKTADGECNSEAQTLRYGFFEQFWGLESLLLQYGVDLVFAGHTHHYERTWPVREGLATQRDYVDARGPVHVQTGIAGVDGSDPFDAPQQPWEAFRDTDFRPSFTRLTFFNDTHAEVAQRHAANGTVFDSFVLQQRAHGPFGRRA